MSKHDYRPLTKMDFSKLVPLNYTVGGNTDYVKYSSIESRITSFEDHEVIGMDTTNTYKIYKIEMGTKGKPIILLSSVVHGTEYAGVHYTLGVLKDIEDNKFHDSTFRNELLNDFHIICVPVVNPWGLNHTTPYAVTQGRNNANNVDVNRDFALFNEIESRNVKKIMDNPDIFAYADNHLIRNHARKPYVAFVGNGQYATDDIRDYIVNSMNNHFSKPTLEWEAFRNMTHGITRRYMRDKENAHTEFTLSYTIELARPVDESASNGGQQRPFSNSNEMYTYGYALTYLFLKTSVEYYKAYNGTGKYYHESVVDKKIEKVIAPEKEVTFNYEGGMVSTVDESFKKGVLSGKKIVSTVSRFSDGRIKGVNRTLS